MADPAATRPYSYDLMNYPSPVIAAQTPNRIAAAGLMFGWKAPDPETGSVLEIGCGDAANLIGCAAVAPKARHVGLDLSLPAIEAGRVLAQGAGLGNVELHHADITTYPRDGEQFDYIIAHGVYAWVPGFVREALLELTAARLKPGGIAYISYDCLPASSAKQTIISFLRPRVAAIADPNQRIDAAFEMIRTLAATQAADSRLKFTLDGLVARLGDDGYRAYFFHDWLSEIYEPSSLGALAHAAARHGLGIVGDAELHDLYLGDLGDAARNWLATEGRDAASHGVLLDILRGDTSFRRTLLSRSNALLPVAWDGIKQLRFAFLGNREELEDGAVKFSSFGRVSMTTRNPREIAVLDLLFANGSEETTLAEVAEEIGGDEAVVHDVVRQAIVVGLLEAHATVPPYTLTPGERPRAGALVRQMARMGEWTINMRHLRVNITTNATRLLLILCNGTLDRAELAARMSAELEQEVPLQTVVDGVEELAQRYLFEA